MNELKIYFWNFIVSLFFFLIFIMFSFTYFICFESKVRFISWPSIFLFFLGISNPLANLFTKTKKLIQNKFFLLLAFLLSLLGIASLIWLFFWYLQNKNSFDGFNSPWNQFNKITFLFTIFIVLWQIFFRFCKKKLMTGSNIGIYGLLIFTLLLSFYPVIVNAKFVNFYFDMGILSWGFLLTQGLLCLSLLNKIMHLSDHSEFFGLSIALLIVSIVNQNVLAMCMAFYFIRESKNLGVKNI